MIFGGQTINFLWGYIPKTELAIQWTQSGSGNWTGSDRGVSEDVYESNISFRGTFAELTLLDTALRGNRENFNITCGTGEEIFGAEIDYTGSLGVTVTKYTPMRRNSYSSYSMDLTLRLLSPSFQSLSPSLDGLILGYEYTANSGHDIYNQFTYDGTADYKDHGTDPGIFEAVFIQTNAEMKLIRRYIAL